MDFLVFIMIAIIISSIVSYFGKKYFKALLVIRNKIKYEILSFVITILIGTAMIALIGIDKNIYMAGGVFGIIDGMVKCSIVFDN